MSNVFLDEFSKSETESVYIGNADVVIGQKCWGYRVLPCVVIASNYITCV